MTIPFLKIEAKTDAGRTMRNAFRVRRKEQFRPHEPAFVKVRFESERSERPHLKRPRQWAGLSFPRGVITVRQICHLFSAKDGHAHAGRDIGMGEDVLEELIRDPAGQTGELNSSVG